MAILAKNSQFWTVFGQNGRNGKFKVLTNSSTNQQARGARSLAKFPKYRNEKKSEKQIFTPKEIFQV